MWAQPLRSLPHPEPRRAKAPAFRVRGPCKFIRLGEPCATDIRMIPQAPGKSNPSIEGGETRAMRKFRRGACFVRRDQCSTRLDRNDKARIIYTAEKLELRTKAKGKKSGALGQSGL